MNREIWVLVADGRRARAFVWRGSHLVAVPGFAFERRVPRNAELASDRPGRVYSRAGGTPSAVEAREDAHRAAKRAFAQDVADRLAGYAGKFAELVIAAAPKTLGDLRRALPPARLKALGVKLAGEIAKDLTAVRPAEIAAQLKKLPRPRAPVLPLVHPTAKAKPAADNKPAATRARAAQRPRKSLATK